MTNSHENTKTRNMSVKVFHAFMASWLTIVFAGTALPAPPALPVLPAQERGRSEAAADPVVGNWRGTLTSAGGVETPIIITIVKKGDVYAGSTNGMNAPSEIPIRKITVDGTHVRIDTLSESRLGDVGLVAELTAEGNTLKGAGTVAVGAQKLDVMLALLRRPRAEVIQPRVEQRADYFLGTWVFEYVGAEVPPVSAGSRKGAAAFTSDGSDFVTGRVDVDAGSRKYQDTLKIGVNPETNMVVFTERRSDGFQLTSLGDWRSPIAITFITSPVQADGKRYQLRRFMRIISDTAFELTEELSIDGGPFKRLGNAHYTKTP
jgi:hypothetical protein